MDSRIRQTATASPAKPGGLPLTLGVVGAELKERLNIAQKAVDEINKIEEDVAAAVVGAVGGAALMTAFALVMLCCRDHVDVHEELQSVDDLLKGSG